MKGKGKLRKRKMSHDSRSTYSRAYFRVENRIYKARRWQISKGQAVDLQEWALEESGTEKFLDSLPELPKKGKIKPGLYISYEIDESELDGGIDWPDVGVATVYAILQDGKREYLGEVRAYNWESIWLSTNEYDEVDDAEEWWRSIKEDMKNSKRVI